MVQCVLQLAGIACAHLRWCCWSTVCSTSLARNSCGGQCATYVATCPDTGIQTLTDLHLHWQYMRQLKADVFCHASVKQPEAGIPHAQVLNAKAYQWI